MADRIEAIHHGQAFICPHCGIFSQQLWIEMPYEQVPGGVRPVYQHDTGVCTHCQRETIWVRKALVYPNLVEGPEPNVDLESEIQDDFNEARIIAAYSPRGAAALLRLCVQKLCVQLGEKGKNIDADIASLVKKGLSTKVQQALDIVRVTGNESVHPGTMDIRDDEEIVEALFDLVNMICENQISEPNKTEALFLKLPAKKLDAIRERDEAT